MNGCETELQEGGGMLPAVELGLMGSITLLETAREKINRLFGFSFRSWRLKAGEKRDALPYCVVSTPNTSKPTNVNHQM